MIFKNIFVCTTDTVSGIGGPINSETLETIYFLKKRPFDKKIMIVAGSLSQIRKFKEWNKEAEAFASKYWPGSTSIIINGQGFRIPKSKKMQKFLIKHGPMYLTSANISGQSPLTLKGAKKTFKEVSKFYFFGKLSNQPSNIYNFDTKKWIIRKEQKKTYN
ncbi:Sua5/YciO/YrdC/YwlC family protein [Mycoplasma crocodyli]|uniref:L-threonylcarbamoyladenylate synthase n=1 Tax=Mycoplasma crocodyli (strain ATCC 51981 / MP145) TaxID=512564 RepID=D5E550_MYCCM|nr:Sua5/YciO/YrdC/YwlC family protein [Mycoplasma crocodyli]ADE19584.1 SUA5-like translation suppressor [Mycoplasma crocodyli MP145]